MRRRQMFAARGPEIAQVLAEQHPAAVEASASKKANKKQPVMRPPKPRVTKPKTTAPA